MTHTDAGALRWLKSRGCSSLFDVGCGPGGQVHLARSMGFRAMGVDVDLRIAGDCVLFSDVAVAPVILPSRADVVWSIEVAEHIPPEGTGNYLRTLTANASRYIVMTASQKPMDLHINIRPVDEWERLIGAMGWVVDMEATAGLLEASTMGREFLIETGRVYAPE